MPEERIANNKLGRVGTSRFVYTRLFDDFPLAVWKAEFKLKNFANQ